MRIPNHRFLYLLAIVACLGSASSVNAQDNAPLLLSTVAGDGYSLNGFGRYGGDGGPAVEASLYSPVDIHLDDRGWLYISDRGNYRLRSVDPSGVITTALVLGSPGQIIGPVLDPAGSAKDSKGNIHVADIGNNRVRTLTRGGDIEVLAGSIQWTNADPFYGDNGPATEASLYGPQQLAVDSQGIVYIADTYNNRIRRITSGGFISTYAGSAERGFEGDGGPALQAALNNPAGVHVGPDGIYIADTLNNRIRKVTSNGIITTVAGNGDYGYNGDGIPATEAALRKPQSVYVAPNGDIYIADTWNDRVRKVNAEGIITTVVGTGVKGRSEDGTRADAARLARPMDIIVVGDTLLIADSENHQVRAAAPMAFWLGADAPASAGIGVGVPIEVRVRTLADLSPYPEPVDVSLGILDGPGTLDAESLTTSDGNAAATLTTTGPGTISLWVHAPGGERRTLEIIALAPADFTGDGRVDFADFLDFAAVFGAAAGSPSYDARFDLSGNNVIDFADFLAFAAEFGT